MIRSGGSRRGGFQSRMRSRTIPLSRPAMRWIGMSLMMRLSGRLLDRSSLQTGDAAGAVAEAGDRDPQPFEDRDIEVGQGGVLGVADVTARLHGPIGASR